ncbi:MAG: hypothetical protein QOG23_1769 [Blastocatellia bacterium]|nr:hypothetical protein [Blastocatellia bacterium]
MDYSAVSQYELGTREPPLPILLKYARLAGISTDVLIDDEIGLPDQIVKAEKTPMIYFSWWETISSLPVCGARWRIGVIFTWTRRANPRVREMLSVA